MGRPKKKIDYEMVKKLGGMMCTQEEIASCLDMCTKTLQRDPEFSLVYKKALDAGHMSLRRLQMKAAEKGNTAMLIFLGKNYLGQRDKFVEEELDEMTKQLEKWKLLTTGVEPGLFDDLVEQEAEQAAEKNN